MTFNTPVAFFIFNRVDTTNKVFEAIRFAKPTNLLVVADGPRTDIPDDIEKCSATRAIIDRVDWDCEILTNYSDVNLGCKHRVSSGLDWVFDMVEEAIILEDDCLPDPTFFRFCDELLNLYRDDERIMHIGGISFLCSSNNLEYSYYFSKYTQVWGWATWRRSWKYYDVEMKLWPLVRNSEWLSAIINEKKEAIVRTKIWDSTYNGECDSWAYQWLFAVLTQNGMSILPKVNLISNIGFSQEATHTKINPSGANLQKFSLTFPLIHPPLMVYDIAADTNYKKIYYSEKHKLQKVRDFFNKF